MRQKQNSVFAVLDRKLVSVFLAEDYYKTDIVSSPINFMNVKYILKLHGLADVRCLSEFPQKIQYTILFHFRITTY